MQKTEWLIFGATFFGAAFAAQKKNCVLLEESCTLGKEFAASFHQKPPKHVLCKTQAGKNFYADLKAHGLITNSGELYVQPAVFLLSDILYRSDVILHFDTVVTDISAETDGFTVTYHNNEGTQQIFAQHIIDTTSCGALYKHPRSKILVAAADKGEIQNEITKLFYISVPFDTNWQTTREALLKKARETQTKIVMLANEFCYPDACTPFTEDRILYAPSDGFYNLLSAFEGGASLAEEI